ncbi:hypothetical protein DM02DRAFT_629067 [Periconia macrospinosa]|uniref:Uncharacterized protein n=1 Tax=Periconia macrospinosa TaxID=97972 RepID=A0A2V1DNR2_9PLEO|nr:hypothetical protein DM02DRAFT_629067 [Periconia macrospinosa]
MQADDVPDRETRAGRQRRLRGAIPEPANNVNWPGAGARDMRNAIQSINQSSGFSKLDARGQEINDTPINHVQIHGSEVAGRDIAHLFQQDQHFQATNWAFERDAMSYAREFIRHASRTVGAGAGHPLQPVNANTNELSRCRIYATMIAFYNQANPMMGHRYSYAVARHRFRPSERILLVYCVGTNRTVGTAWGVRTANNSRYDPVRSELMDQLVEDFNITHVYLSNKLFPELQQLPNLCGRHTLHFLQLLKENGHNGFDEKASWVRKMGLREMKWNMRRRDPISGRWVNVKQYRNMRRCQAYIVTVSFTN